MHGLFGRNFEGVLGAQDAGLRTSEQTVDTMKMYQ